MDKLKLYFRESYEELVHKVTWPTWPSLISTTRVVLVATILIALLILLMNVVSSQALSLIY